MADYELHADYNRNGRLDASSTEYTPACTMACTMAPLRKAAL
jgi:hypothetical protein